MLRVLKPPMNPEEAIHSRRTPCYGFAVVADIQNDPKLVSLLNETRDSILDIIDPLRSTKKRPIRSSLYIKQKFFHASVFGMQPLLDEQQFFEIYANKGGQLNHEALDNMCSTLHTHLNEQKPYLEPIKCEIMHKDGTILARFLYKTEGPVFDDAPLLTLTKQLDPEKKFSAWDASNILRYTTVAVVICVVNIQEISDKLEAIQVQLDITSQKLQERGRFQISQFHLIDSYDKRTLSLKHISMYATVERSQIRKLQFARSELNDRESLPERVLNDLVRKNEIAVTDLSTNASNLHQEYTAAESIGAEHVSLDDTDIIVVLSGRSGFKGTYLEKADKYTLCPNEFDESDTARRMSYGISIAKKCMKDNILIGIKKPVYIYFNGVKRQNDELRKILDRDGSYDGYPANLFVIDSIPLDNTLGQVIGLNKYLHSYWPLFCHKFGLSRAPNIIFCTSSYHVPRVVLGVGSNSPLLTPEFWHSRPELLKQLTPEMIDYVLNPGDTLKSSTIMVLGCDRQITANPFGEKDLFGDMQARVNYSSLHRVNNFNISPVPSIAPSVGNNIVTLFRANIKIGLRRELRMLDQTVERRLREDSALPDDAVPKITLC